MTFNPKSYFLKADEAVDKYNERRAFEAENAHLAMPFFVEGLREMIPDQYPSEMAIVGTASGEGKSLIMKAWHDAVQEHVTNQKKRAVTPYISHEDTTEMSAGALLKKHNGNRAQIDDNLTAYIGRSFGMSQDDIADLHMTNVIAALNYGQNQAYSEKMPYSAIFYDYIQTTPPDPFRRDMTNDSQRRMQIADDTKRLFNMATSFFCPVIAAAQTSLKKMERPYNSLMLIPGKRDFEEAKEIYQIPDRVYSGWMPSGTYPVGKLIEIDNWKFNVESNQFFLWVLKMRYHTPDTCKGIRKVYPLRIQSDGTFLYDKEYHKSLLVSVSNA